MNEEIKINGLRVNYRVSGQGKPVIILHGWGSNLKPWSNVQEKISARGFKVIVPDLIGFGRSDLPPKGWNMDEYAEWFESFVKEISEKHNEFKRPVFLIGHSFGGRILIKIAARKKLLLRGIVLCAAAGLKSDISLKIQMISGVSKSAARLIDSLKLSRLKDPIRNLYYHLLRQNDYLKVPETMRDTFRKVIEEDLSGYLPEIKSPTLIVWGKEDRVVPVKQAYRFYQGIDNSTLKIITGVGHSPQLERPEDLTDFLLEFFNNH